MDEDLEKYCGSKLWDRNLTWDTDDPSLTKCFQGTFLIWVPCGFLWLASFIDVFFKGSYLLGTNILDQPTWKSGWTRLTLFKVLNVTLLICLQVGNILVNWHENTNNGHGSTVDTLPEVLWVTPLLMIVTYFISAVLVVIHKIRCVHTSGIQFIYWAFLLLAHIVVLRSGIKGYMKNEISVLSLTLLATQVVIMSCQFVLFCWADIPKSKDENVLVNIRAKRHPESPMVRASCLSYILFSWSTSLVKKGYRQPLTMDDLWDLIPSVTAKPVMELFEKHYGKPKYTRSVFRNILLPIWKTCGFSFIIAITCRLTENLLMYSSPKLMGYLMEFVEDDKIQVWKGYMLAVLLLLSYIVTTCLLEQFYLHMFKCYVNIMICLDLKIYKKSLCISCDARKETTTGEIVNLMSVDVESIRELVYMADAIWGTPIQLTLGIYLLWSELGYAVFVGIAVLVMLIPINWVISTFTAKYQRARMKKKDERIKVLNEVLSGIQIIKLYAWEPSFLAEIQTIRSDEIGILTKRAYLNCVVDFLFDTVPFLVSMAAFIAFVYQDGEKALTPKRAFTALSLFNLLTDPITSFPQCISLLVDAIVSFKRVNKFLNAEEIDPAASKFEEKSYYLPAIEIAKGNYSWSRDAVYLKNIDFTVEPESFTAVVGSVASGKSSLLSAILGEMQHSGECIVRGSVAYASQIAWILNGTLRENICFGLPYEKKKYDKIIEACCLAPDLAMLPAADLTEIGEKGVNLSGGQKQRVSLARAAYSGADILLLDDVLSAVDAHVGKHIFDKLLGPSGYLANKTRVLCTHAYNFLSQVDSIVVMSEGQIVESGSYDELMGNGGDFSQLLSKHVQSKGEANHDEIVSQISNIEPNSENDEDNDALQAGRLIEEESTETGDVKLSVFMTYLRAMRIPIVCMFCLLFCASEGMGLGRNFVLSEWTQEVQSSKGGTSKSYVIQYIALGFGQSISYLLGCIALVIAALTATKSLHNNMLNRVLRAPMSFFNVNLLGRIVNRFSTDVENVDKTLPGYLGDWVCFTFKLIGILVAITYTNIYFICFIVPMFIIYYVLQRYYISCMQQLQRLKSTLNSSIYAQFSETLNGTSTIRSYRAQDRFTNMLADKIDNFNRALFPHLIVRRWLSIRLGILGSLVVFIPAILAVMSRKKLNASLVGLSITYALQITSILSWLIKVTSYIQYNFVAVERIIDYSKLEQEAELNVRDPKIDPKWPDRGAIVFDNYETRYRPGLEPVLKGLSLKIYPGEKIGIVGRTGAGKSSLMLALFRIIEATNGKILIDDVNISTLGLHDLRKRLTVIPQDPILFSRSLRLNLDPFSEYEDDQLWQALELAHLKSYFVSQPEGLNYSIAEGGENLSVGQRQLTCLARAILRKSSVLVLDEATASVDSHTDELIQNTIRTTFTDCTILNVAHRLKTVLDSSRILVLSHGQVIEFDSPGALLSDKLSHFYGMAKDAGILGHV